MLKVISKTFTFEAAHALKVSTKKLNRNVHGHSFHVEVFLSGEIDKNGFIIDFSKLERSIKTIKGQLDHSFLNDIKGLQNPTLEKIGEWIWSELIKNYKNLHEVKIKRKTCGECFTIRA